MLKLPFEINCIIKEDEIYHSLQNFIESHKSVSIVDYINLNHSNTSNIFTITPENTTWKKSSKILYDLTKYECPTFREVALKNATARNLLLDMMTGFGITAAAHASRMLEVHQEISKQHCMISKVYQKVSEQRRFIRAIEQAGWLPHPAIPRTIVQEYLECDAAELQAEIGHYFKTNWPEVEIMLRRRLDNAGLDDETIAVMDEAFRAHGAGLYRAVCRTVFPEIERVARQRFYGLDHLQPITSLKEVRAAIADLAPSDLRPLEVWWILSAFGFINRRCYVTVDSLSDNANESGIMLNRHAVAHGVGSPSTARESLNMLFLADFMFHALDALARRSNPPTDCAA